MEEKEFDLERYLTAGVEDMVRDMLKAAVFHPAEAAFMAKFALESRRAAERRHALEAAGEHIPTYLICSVTSVCNLHCVGCYARSLETCEDGAPTAQLTGEDWGRIFSEAAELGISFILLAGGEPMVRRDVIRSAAEHPEILFPIFTNGTLMNDEYMALFREHRNLAPVFSIEGGETATDNRRGAGIYARVRRAMEKLREDRILFGASVTVTSENLAEVTSDAFLDELRELGCKAVIFVEYVPTAHESRSLALSDGQRETLAGRLSELRGREDSLLLVSFPGDEKASGGCLAAGRGFFHINSHGGAEPCPFSPYSDINVRDTSLREAMRSPLFTSLRESGILLEEHEGGCTLFARRKDVEALLSKT